MAKEIGKDKEKLNISNHLVEELLSKANPSELFGRDGLFQHLKKQISVQDKEIKERIKNSR
ncbi:hypothetical protein [Candidatus Tisiphia endosymbiont of Micropterix aruncella]|uniref:hypothetical protein n=1 Tax=Candidatus Tisiphia endosymbiont of Micropterix aruncella TaxID=3066271 RepID=UPI003AA8BDC1